MPEQSSEQSSAQSSFQTGDLTVLWEQMGASTGSFLGKTIGLSAQYALQAYEQMIILPLQQMQQTAAVNGPPPSETGIPGNIREQTWRTMGKQYGETIGMSVGMAMDLLINSLKASAAGMPGFNQQTRPKDPGPRNP